MKLDDSILEALAVEPGDAADLAGRDTVLTGKGAAGLRQAAEQDLQAFTVELAKAQELLYANATHGLLLVLQGLDASGKDGTVKHVMSGVNPQGCEVVSFKSPSAEDLEHAFLWRCARAVPGRGHIGIFNRSHYEEVLVVRVHPELLAAEPGRPQPSPGLWKGRYEDINAFEHHLRRNGTQIVKVFLHLSKDEQKRRLLARLDDASKHWKFSSSDIAERRHWDEYQAAYEEALTATSTSWAPWYVVPADSKPVARALVAAAMVKAIHGMDLSMPEVGAETQAQIEAAKTELLNE